MTVAFPGLDNRQLFRASLKTLMQMKAEVQKMKLRKYKTNRKETMDHVIKYSYVNDIHFYTDIPSLSLLA